MTESELPQPENAPESATAPTAKRRPRRWRRRLLWAAAILLVLGLILRIALVLLLPTILSAVAKRYNLNCRYERVHLSILAAEVEVWHLVVEPQEGGEPFVEAEYCALDVAVWPLLVGQVVVRTAEVDGMDLFVDRDEDGSIPLLARFVREPAPEDAEEDLPEVSPEAEPEPVDLSPPIRIDALRGQLVHLQVRDRTVTPAVEFRADFNVRVSHLGSPTRPTRVLVTAYSGALVDAIQLEGRVRGAGNALEAEGSLMVRGLRLAPLAPQLQRLGLRPSAGTMNLEGRGRIVTANSAVCPGAISGSLSFDGLRATADGEEFLALDRLEVGVRSIDFRLADLEGISVEGGRLSVERLEDGAIQVGGIATLLGRSAADKASTPSADAAPARPVKTRIEPPSDPTYRVRSGLVTLRDLGLTFRDHATTPTTDLAVKVESILVTGIDRNPERLETPCQIDLIASAPGMAETVTATTTLAPFAPRKTFESAIRVGGITAKAAAPYLSAAGLEPALHDGALSIDVRGEVALDDDDAIAAELSLRDVRYADGDEELAGLDSLEIRGLRLPKSGGGIAIASIEVAGPRARLRRDADGNLDGMGLRLPARSAATSVEASARETAPAESPSEEPSPAPIAGGAPIAIERISVTEGAVRFRDDGLETPQETGIVDASFEVEGLTVPGGADPVEKPAEAATIRGSFRADGILDQASLEGTLLVAGAGGAVDLLARADGITLAALGPYLEPAGIRPELQKGAAELRLHGSWSQSDGFPRVDAAISAVHFRDGDDELAGLDAFAIGGLAMGPEGITVDSLRVQSPRISALRDAEGDLRLLGFRVHPPAPTEQQEPDEEEPPPVEDVAPERKPVALPRIALKSLELTGASISVRDTFVEPAFETTLGVEAGASSLVLAPDSSPAPFHLRCRISDCVQEISVEGEIVTRPEDAKASFLVRATGIRNAALKPYFPPTLQPVLEDGRFAAKVELHAGRHSEGGYVAGISVDEILYRDEAAGKDLLAIGAVRLASRRIDPTEGVIALEEISVRGVKTEAWRLDGGAVRFLGFVARPASPGESSSAATKEDGGVEGAQGGDGETTDPRPNASRPRQRRLETIVDLELAKLDLHLERFALIDETRDDSVPVVVSDVRLEAVDPIRLLGPHPEENPPVRLAVRGAVAPLIETFSVAVEARPFEAEPHILATLDASGIRGAGLTEAFPDLASLLDGAELEDGRVHAELEATLSVRRQGATGFDLSQGIGGHFLLKGATFRDGPEGEVLAGVDGVELSGLRVQPATGEIRAAALEVTTPRLRLAREEEGIRVLDLLVRLPSSPSAAPEAEPEPQEDAAETAEPPAPAAPVPEDATAEAPAEIAVSRISVHGLDVRIEDRSVTPPTLIPLTDLSLDIRGVSTRALVEERPIRCSLSLTSGKVPLSKTPAQGMLGGALIDTVDLVTTGTVETAEEVEERAMFQEVTLDARLHLYPERRGKVKATVSGFELEAIRGLAAASGIELDAGIFDNVLEVEFTKDGTLELDSTAVFTNLSVTEPPDGPIFRYLHLPAPLQPVVFALRNENGELRIPLSVSMADASPSMGDVTGAALSTLSQLIGNAFLRSPLRMGKSVVGLVGFGGDETPQEEEPIVVPFRSGASVPTADALVALRPLIERLEDGESLSITLRHRLGTSDVERATVLANPSPEECHELLASLERRRRQLSEERDVLARTIVHTLGAGLDAEARRARIRAQEMETEIGLLEGAFDRIYDLLRPGADRYAAKRLRKACIDLGQTRLAEVRKTLQKLAPSGSEERIRVQRARVQVSEEETGAVVAEITRRKAE